MNTASRSEQSRSSEPFPHEEMIGNIASTASLKLHTRLASSLWLGRVENKSRKIHPIVGLARFGRQTATIWQESAKDNPVADMVLIRIEQRYEEARAILEENLAEVKNLLEDQETFESIDGGESNMPMVVQLDFNNQWGFRGAALLKMYDDIVRYCLIAKHIGLYNLEDWQKLVDLSGRKLRGFFGSVLSMPQTHLERAWIKDKRFSRELKKAKRQLSREGMRLPFIPPEILNREKLPKERPERIARKQEAPLRELKNQPEAFAKALPKAPGPMTKRPDTQAEIDALMNSSSIYKYIFSSRANYNPNSDRESSMKRESINPAGLKKDNDNDNRKNNP